jgi:hypothetical protein
MNFAIQNIKIKINQFTCLTTEETTIGEKPLDKMPIPVAKELIIPL